MDSPSRLERLFRAVVARRRLVILLWSLLLPGAVWLALRIPSDGAIDRLVVESDPDVAETRAFQKVFPEGQQVVLLVESEDPYRPEALRELAALEEAVARVPGVKPFSALSTWRRAHPDLAEPGFAEAFRRFATGTDLFRRQGLVGERHAAIALALTVKGAAERNAALEALDRAIAAQPRSALGEIRRVGAPYVEAWLEAETHGATVRYFPLFGLFVVVLALVLYRSWRALAAILLTLAATVAVSVGLGSLLGFTFTIVSEIVPLMVLVTTTATLVYLHSRYIQQPGGVPVDEHQAQALANKALPVTASVLAAILGFAALAVSQIRPIRDMGLWTAAGLVVSWLASFTLFPALQKALSTPTRQGQPPAGRLYARLAEALPGFTWRWRWELVGSSLVLAAAGAVALFGWPGRIAPMHMEVDALAYMDESLPLRSDMLRYEEAISGLAVVRVWIQGPAGSAVEPEFLQGVERFSRTLERQPKVSSVVGPTTILRMRRWLASQGDTLPEDPDEFAAATADLEQLLLTEPEMRGFIDMDSLGHAQLMVVTRRGEAADFEALRDRAMALWREEASRTPALRGAQAKVVGESILQAKIASHLVPTLTESFAITAALIFVAFLFVFRSGSARLMAMIPSLFAILATFLVMRLTGIPLNVATILIATTVLGTTENDQIHFFHHFQEARKTGASLEDALRHTLRVSGHAIIYATIINAGGFLALAFSQLPPMRQFGIVTSIAFAFSLLADFTALPASLWILMRERTPQAVKAGAVDPQP